MKERNKNKISFHSIIVKFLLAFLLFGGLLVMVTVTIEKDLAETTTENLTAAQEELSLTVLEKNLGDGEWSIKDHVLYKGTTAVGDGLLQHACIAPFIKTQSETDSFVYSFIDSTLADPSIVSACTADGAEPTAFLRVAGSTLDANGDPIVGTFLDLAISAELAKSDVFTGRSLVGGRLFYCYYQVIRDADGHQAGAVVAGRSIEELIQKTNRSALNSSLSISVIILYTFLALFLFVAKWNRSLKRMEQYLSDIGSGSFPDDPLVISSRDEMGEMADVINEMKQSLAEKERLRNELALAQTIQAEMLPDEAAARNLPENCLVTGLMTPAREVGGDLYDFFMIDHDRLGLVIADVSDKGAPAALFMATAKMCIKDNMMLGLEPKDVLNNVNNRLLENNRSGLFVTAWIGELDLRSGHLKYALAGHPYPLLKHGKEADYDFLKSDKNLVLAGLPDFEFRQAETDLDAGDRLFLYTDGLDEARSADNSFFGKQRILDYLGEHKNDDISSTTAGLKNAVDSFASGREQFDDLTMLMVEYGGSSHE